LTDEGQRPERGDGRPTHWRHPVDERRRAARVRRQRRRRLALIVFALAAVGAGSAYYYLASDERVEQFAESYLENLLGTHVGIRHASFSLGEGLVLTDLVVSPPPPFEEVMLEAPRVDLKIDALSLLRLRPGVMEIVVHRPTINLVLWDEKVWNFQALVRARPPEAVAPRVRPVVSLDAGTLRIMRKIAGEPVYEHDMEVSGLLLPSEADPHTFRFQTDVKSREVHLAVASGLLNARTAALRFEGHASNVVLSEELYRSLPSEVRQIWNRFEPTGSVNVKVLFDEKQGFHLETELTGVGFAYEYEGLTHTFENLTGRCAFSPTSLRLTDVQGLMNGWPVGLDGVVTGFAGEHLSMDLTVSADQVDLERCKALLVGVAPHMEVVYYAYSPKGEADVRLQVRRGPDKGTGLEVSGDLFCRGMEMTYRLFPYTLERLRGKVHFTPQGYKTEGVEGYHGDARVRLVGWAKNPGPTCESHVKVYGRGVPLDEDLRQALAKPQRDVYDLYAPSGVADMDVEVYRPPVPNPRRRVVVEMTLLDCDLEYANFPYRLTNTTGKVIIAPGRTQIVDVRGRHGQADVVLSGELVSRKDGPPVLNLKVSGEDVALDEDLERALPERERNTLKTFHLSGLADIEGTVTRGPQTGDRLDYDLAIRLNGARMIYEPFPFLAEQVTGDLRLTRGACRIESLTGFNSGARVEAAGWIEQRPDDYALDLVVTGKDVALSESLRGALGPEMRSVWSHLRPQGRVDVEAHLTKALGPDEGLKHHVWVTLHDAQATLDIFPYPLQHVTGQMEFQGGEVRLHEVRARNGLTEFVLGSGQRPARIAYDEHGPTFELSIKAKGLRLEGPLNEALPAPLRKAFAAVRPTGRVDLDLSRLTFRRTDEGQRRADWYGTAVLDEVGLTPGMKMSGLVGTAEMMGRWTDGKVAFQGEMRIQQGKVADKDIVDTRFRVEKSEQDRAVSIKRFEGGFYGGRIEGFASIGLGASRAYAFNLSAADVNLERLLREGFRLEHNITGGLLRGTLGLRARGPDAKVVEASGYVYVTEAKLYELPLIVRLINVLRLGPPDRTAFQKARVLYFLRDKRLILGDIRLEGRALNLYGAGTMDADGRLNLTFMTGKKDDDPLIPALSELAEGLRKQIVVVRVTGTLAEPQVEMRTLSAITAPIREFIALVREQRGRDGRTAAQ